MVFGAATPPSVLKSQDDTARPLQDGLHFMSYAKREEIRSYGSSLHHQGSFFFHF